MHTIPNTSTGQLDLHALQSGTREAFNLLYEKYSAAIYGVLCNMLKDEELAGDAMQEVFVKIWKNIQSYDTSKGTLFTWMLNISRNHAIDMLRKKNRNPEQALPDNPNAAGTSKGTFIEGIGLKQLVTTLDPEQQKIIDLIYFKGFSQSEVAEQLNIPLGTVKSRVRLAIAKLRTFFEKK